MKMKNNLSFLIIFLIITTLISCKKEENNNSEYSFSLESKYDSIRS